MTGEECSNSMFFVFWFFFFLGGGGGREGGLQYKDLFHALGRNTFFKKITRVKRFRDLLKEPRFAEAEATARVLRSWARNLTEIT